MFRATVCLIVLHVFNNEVLSMESVTLHGVTDTLKPEQSKYAKALETAAEAFKEAESLFTDKAWVEKKGWKKDAETEGGDIVYSKHTPLGKMVTVSTVLEGQVDNVMTETWTAVDGLPEWNPNINFARTVATLTDHVDLVTYGNNDVLIVTGRDFVSVRLYRKVGDGYIMASRSVDLAEMPEKKDKVRAHLHLAAARFRPDPSAPSSKTLCDVAMLVDLKGMLPKILVNQVIPKIMVMDTEENVKHFKELAEKQSKNGN